MNIYVAREGHTYGPYPKQEAHELIDEGQLHAEDLACPEGASEWNPLGQLLGLAPPETPTSMPLHSNADGIPFAQPASAVTPPGYHPFDEPKGEPVEPEEPRSPAAKALVSRLERELATAKTLAGSAAALGFIALGLPLLALVAGPEASGGLAGLLGGTLGVLPATAIGASGAIACFWWFRSSQKKAMVANSKLQAARNGGLL